MTSNRKDDRANEVRFHKVAIPEAIHADKSCFGIRHVMSPKECAKTISRAEIAGFGQVLVNVDGGEMLIADYRKSDRCIINDHTFAETLFERIKGMLPETIEGIEGHGN